MAEYRLHEANASGNAERMFMVSLEVLRKELPCLQGDPEKLRMYRRGIKFIQRQFGRRLTRELIGNRKPMNPESRRKLDVLRRHYLAGFTAVVVSRALPANLIHKLIAVRVHPNEHARSADSCESLIVG